MEKLFVYGTLAPGKPNHYVLEDVPGNWSPASIRGQLHNQGWGADQGCPGVIPKDDGEPIQGFIFSSPELAANWEKLDAFEGEEYRRVKVNVETEDGQTIEAFVYALNLDG